MGFKDCMAMLRDREPVSKLDALVQHHAEEDAEHWRWFLNDLNTLNIDGIAQRPPTEILYDLWSDERRAVREAVYAVSHCIQYYQSPAIRLILVEVIEAGYACFTQAMSPVMEKAGLYDQLQYFGHTHNHAEASHELHQNAHDDALEQALSSLNSEQRDAAMTMIDDIEEKIDLMHSCFARAIDKAHQATLSPVRQQQ